LNTALWVSVLIEIRIHVWRMEFNVLYEDVLPPVGRRANLRDYREIGTGFG
jgi:hypothetical protein